MSFTQASSDNKDNIPVSQKLEKVKGEIYDWYIDQALPLKDVQSRLADVGLDPR